MEATDSDLINSLMQPADEAELGDDPNLSDDDLDLEDLDLNDPETEDGEGDEPEGDEPEGEGNEDDAADDYLSDDTLITVTVDGTDTEVTFAELRRGYSGQAFIQQGMQRAAHAQRQAQAIHAALEQQRAQLGALVQQAKDGQLPVAPTPPDQALAVSDPMRYANEMQAYVANKERFDTDVQSFQQNATQQSRAEQQAMQAYMQSEAQNLLVLEPELSQPDKAKVFHEALHTAAASYGYAPEEVNGLIDHRAMLVLRDAGRYRELVANGGTATQLANAAKKGNGKKTKVLRPGAKKRPTAVRRKTRQKQQQRFAQSGDIRDAIGLITAPPQ